MAIFGTKANVLPVLAGSIPDTQLILVPDPVTGELKRSTFGQVKADIVIAIGDLSYLDDIIEVATIADLPQPGEVKKIYVITTGADANKQFRWGGSIYIEFPQGSGDVAGEAIIRGNADTALQAAIDAEAATRLANDQDLWHGLESEGTARNNADVILQGNISAEANTRSTNDNILQGLINTEGTVRATADNALSARIDALEDEPGGAGAWGGINGNIEDQEDLQTALDAKLNISDYTPVDISGKVDKVTGKGLSTEDYTTTEKNKLDGIAAGAQVNDANTTTQGNTFNGASQLVQTDATGKLPAIDGSQLTNLPSGGITAATSTEINTGTDNTKGATPAGLAGSKYVTQDGAKLFTVATGTNTYAGSLTPAITTVVTGMRVNVQFTNANTGASTFNLNSTGAKNIYKGGTNALVANDISAGQIIGLVYDGTYWQLQGSTQAFPSTANKVITTNGSGALQAANDLIDVNSTTTESTLIAATWTAGVATATGTPGTWVLGTTSNYLYICTGTNTWIRIPAYLDYLDVYLGSVSDSGGVKTSTQMAALYPAAVRGQYAMGTAGKYEYMGLSGWFYFANTITP